MRFLGLAFALALGAWAAPPQAGGDISAPPGSSFFGLTPQFAVSADGKQVVFVVQTGIAPAMLWVRPLDGTARALAGTEQASYPFWSPDGESIGFFAGGKLKRISVRAGTPTVLCDAPAGRGGAWSGANVIVFASGITDPLKKVSAAGGEVSNATALDPARENSHRWPSFLPDGHHFLFWAGGASAPSVLKAGSIESPDTVTVIAADTNGAYYDGHLFFGARNALMAASFDPDSLHASGDPVSMAEPLSGDPGSNFASLSASAAGALLYTKGAPRGLVLTWLDRSGRKVGSVGSPRQYTNVAIHGTCAAVSMTEGAPPNRDIWLQAVGVPAQLRGRTEARDAEGCPSRRITNDPGVDATPIWSPDGQDVLFSSQRDGPYQLMRRSIDGRSPEQIVLKTDVAAIATDWSRDGQSIVYTRGTAGTGLGVWVLPLSGDRQPYAVVSGQSADNAVFSPDSRWIAYQSAESGSVEIRIRPIAIAEGARGAVAPIQVSRAGGTQPLWRSDGKEIFFLGADGAVMSAAIRSTSSTLEAEPPKKLFGAPLSLVLRRAYDVTSDGQNFLVPLLNDAVSQTITVLTRGPGR